MENNWPKSWPKVVEESLDKLYTFDPNGDVLLLLQKKISVRVDENKSVRDEAHVQEGSDQESVTLKETSPLYDPFDERSPDSQLPTGTKEDGLWDLTTSQSGQAEELAPGFTFTVYLRVSSRHLILASAMFNTMLSSDVFSDGREFRSEGTLVVELDDDPEALIILMHVVHGMTRKVPRDISLHTLADLAHLVNYYGLHEAVELFSDTWITCSRENLHLESYNPEVVLRWLFISWVFQKEDDFKKMTRILIYESDDGLQDEIDDEEIPIPASIILSIQRYRIKAIKQTITVIYDQITTYTTPSILCNNNMQLLCDAAVLGSLIKSSAIIGILPRPELPYHGMTFKDLASQVRAMEVLDQCKPSSIYYNNNNKNMGHGVKDAIEATIRSLEDQLYGLNLDSFLLDAERRKKAKTKNHDESG